MMEEKEVMHEVDIDTVTVVTSSIEAGIKTIGSGHITEIRTIMKGMVEKMILTHSMEGPAGTIILKIADRVYNMANNRTDMQWRYELGLLAKHLLIDGVRKNMLQYRGDRGIESVGAWLNDGVDNGSYTQELMFDADLVKNNYTETIQIAYEWNFAVNHNYRTLEQIVECIPVVDGLHTESFYDRLLLAAVRRTSGMIHMTAKKLMLEGGTISLDSVSAYRTTGGKR